MVGAPAAVIIIYWRLNCYHQAGAEHPDNVVRAAFYLRRGGSLIISTTHIHTLHKSIVMDN